MKKIKFKLKNLTCASCITDIEKAVAKQKGVTVRVSLATSAVQYEYDETLWNEQSLLELTKKIGYETAE